MVLCVVTPTTPYNNTFVAILTQFCQWLKDYDGAKKSDKDATQYSRQVGEVFERAGVHDTTLLPDMSTSIKQKFVNHAQKEGRCLVQR